MARGLLEEHGLSGWQFQIDNARQRCGSCHYQRREITLSRHFIKLNSATEIRITLLHEIAHALVGPGQAHGPQWQQAARRLGIPVQATTATAHMPEPAWRLHCRNCLQIVARRHRRSLKLANHRCAHCGPQLGLLEWQANG